MIWRKPANMKFTDMCVYVDQHIPDLVSGENKEIENTVYNYLWLLIKALAIKKNMFSNYNDYDAYAFYGAKRIFFALKRNQINQGKTIKGKLIRPIKSCLNYTKALLYPMKVEYQNETFNEVISEDFVSKKFDSFSMKEKMKAETSTAEGVDDLFWTYLLEAMSKNKAIIDNVLKRVPFAQNSLEYKYLRISVLANLVNMLKLRKKLDVLPISITLWKLPKSMSNYLRVILNEVLMEIKKEIMECYQEVAFDDETLEKLITYTNMETDNNSYED